MVQSNSGVMFTRPQSDEPKVGLRWTCVVLAGVACLPGLRLLSFIWDHTDYLGHAYLIPPCSFLLLYSRRVEVLDALRRGPIPAMGPLWVLLAVLFEMAAVAGEITTLAGLGIPLLLATTAYAVGGMPLLRAAGLPIAFLILMVPPPGLVEAPLLVQLKLMVTQVAVSLLQWLGFTVGSSGNVIYVPGHELFVADACAGLTAIVTLTPLGVIVAYFLGHGIWRRALIVASIVPLAIFANIVRVTATVALVTQLGGEVAQGVLHESFGLVTFTIGTIALIGIAKALR
jgi:exosortase